MSSSTLVGVALVVFCAAFVQGLSGFGFSLLAIPLLAALLGAKEAVVLGDTVALFATGGMAIRMRSDVDRPLASHILIGSFIGMPIGLVVLLTVDERLLGALIGVVVLCFVVVMATGTSTRAAAHDEGSSGRRSGTGVDVGVGVCSGILNTSVGTSGPPVVMLLTARGLEPNGFRATTSTVFGVSAVVAVTLFALSGSYDADIATAFVWSLPALPLGWWAGERLHRRLDPSRFRWVVLGLLASSAVASVVGALAG